MLVYEVIPGIFVFFSYISSFKTYSTGYFRKQQIENGYFRGMTLCNVCLMAITETYFTLIS